MGILGFVKLPPVTWSLKKIKLLFKIPIVSKHFFWNCKESFFCVFFFSGKVYTSLTQSNSQPEKKQGRKKKRIFTHSLDFCPKVVKNKLFREKKNGTFDLVCTKQNEKSTKKYYFLLTNRQKQSAIHTHTHIDTHTHTHKIKKKSSGTKVRS